MSLEKKIFADYIKQFKFRELFNEMGWNNDRTKQQPIVIDNITFSIESVAEKSGFKILVCHPRPDGLITEYAVRKKIEGKITKLFQEHLIIYIDKKQTEQIWQLVIRQSGKPARVTETRYATNQEPELLYQKASGLLFEMDEEEHITIIDVTKRIADNFHQNTEKVTKKFYTEFKKEHTSFIDFIKGISERTNQEWYASLMMNRLMFCYFIQKKGFLDDNKNYLQDKLKECREKKSKTKFYSFYRNFLLVLFHEGLNSPKSDAKVKVEIGKIPYLNGGLFDKHELESDYQKIEIEDKAFERLFDFFDKYTWHLDTRVSSSGTDINPDVIGYIFEKYINDRANMGAYYTKEDITDYIGKNCIIPYLMDEAKRNYAKPFKPDGEVWKMVKESGDRYIYDAVKKGNELTLPEEIEKGVDTNLPHLIERRKEWNKPADEQYALPTEIWRETVERRKRYQTVKAKIDGGEILQINDFITYNLNIIAFAEDVIDNTNDPDLIWQWYKALTKVTIIDPTCGSGAFLFAAMNILEPLYDKCIARMRAFVEDEDRLNVDNKKNFSHKYKDFKLRLENIQNPQHPNQQYFIYKSIILRNLYGVDIMKEAVEIAKLRLFLKLVATVDVDYSKKNYGLEPLPDIDFNIRAGNTLVGFATEKELDRALDYTMDGVLAKPLIKENCEKVAMTFERYKFIQLNHGEDYTKFKEAKDDLKERLEELNNELHQLLHKQASALKYENWLASHQPFHWFAEFYEIIHGNGGFDVIIGNPPYVEYGTKLKAVYTLKDYSTLECGNLHAYVAERCYKMVSENGLIGLIIPLPSINTSRMVNLQNIIKPKPKKRGRNVWISAFDERPSSLFEGVDQRLIIELIGKETEEGSLFTTSIKRWYSSTRENLFPSINYSKQSEKNLSYTSSILKIQNNHLETRILNSFYSNKSISYLKSDHPTKNVIYYRTAGGRYWKVITDKQSGTNTVSEKAAYFRNLTSHQAVAITSSSTFWWYYSCHFDMFNLKDYMIFGFRLSDASPKTLNQLSKLGKDYLKILEHNAELKTIKSKTKGTIEQKQFVVSKSKSIIDEIDTVLAQHYGFTEEELDFIINYDIKYRMGKEFDTEDEE